MGIPEDHGSREMVDENREHTFILGESRVFPIEILYGDKVELVSELEGHVQAPLGIFSI